MRLLVLLLSVAAVEASYGYANEALTNMAFESIVDESLHLPRPTAELTALTPAARATAVTALGKVVRAAFESATFKARYHDYAVQQRAPLPAPKQPYDKFVADKKQELAKQRSAAETSLAQLDAAQRKQMKDMLEQSYNAQLKMFSDRGTVEMLEQQRFETEKQRYEASVVQYPDDPKAKLRTLLNRFLADTADVDYSAKTVARDGGQRFVMDSYETKPTDWKRAYRAGKPASEAARSFAREWLAAIGG